MSAGSQAGTVVAQGPSQKPSRLPLHRCRPSSTNKSTAAPPVSSPCSHSASSNTSVHDANKRTERLINGPRSAQKTSQVEQNRKLLQDRQSVAGEVPSCKRPQPKPHTRLRHATSVVGVSPAAATKQNAIGNGSVINDLRYAARPGDSPSCGARMSALRSERRRQQPSGQSPPSSVKSSSSTASGRHASAAALSNDAAADGVQPRRAPVAPRRSVRLSTSSATTDDCSVSDRQHSRTTSDSYFCRKSATSRAESDEIISPRFIRLRPPALRHLPAAAQQIDKSQRRLDSYQPTSDVCMSNDNVRDSGHQQRSAASAVETPRRRYYRLWRLSADSDVDNVDKVGSVSTITSIDFSSSSSETLTDDADESAGESTTTAGRSKRRRNRSHHDTPDNAPPPLCGATTNNDHKSRTKPRSRISRASSSSSELSSPPSASTPSAMNSRQPAIRYWEDTQRIGNFGMRPRAPVTASKPTVSPPQQKLRSSANSPRNRPVLAYASDEFAASARTNNTPWSPRRLAPKSTTAVVENPAKHAVHSSSVVAAVGQTSPDNPSVQATLSPILKSTAVKHPKVPSHSNMQTHQTDAVKKTASEMNVSNSKSSVSYCPASASSKLAYQSPLRRAAGTVDTHAASKIPSASQSRNANNDRKVVDRSVGNTAAGVVASRGTVKPVSAVAVKQVRSSQSETDHSNDSSHPTKTVRFVPTPSAITQTSCTVVPGSVESRRGNDAAAVTRRPPPSPSKLKKPGGSSAAADRRRVHEQRRPASMDCSAVSVASQQPVDVYCKKSDSCANVANLSKSIEQATTTKNSTKATLNTNAQLAKSCDCITPLSSNTKRENSEMICSEMNGSSTSLVDMPLRKLMKPYTVINRCSVFGRRMTALKKLLTTDTGCNVQIDKGNMAASNRSSLASQARASELTDLPEVDEFECDRKVSAVDRLTTDEENIDSDCVRHKSTAERTVTVKSPSVCPSSQQNLSERYKYRTEYSTFLSAVPPKGDDKLIVETVQVTNTNSNSTSYRDCVLVSIKNDENESCSVTTKLPGNCHRQSSHDCSHKIEGLVELANESHISEARPVKSSAEIPIVEDAAATAEKTDKPSSADNYVVTYESDNIVVLDREPVIDCLTPDGDVVSTLLTVPAHGVGAASVEGGLSRTLPLSESGYDTWKSSQGSVAVANTCTVDACAVAPDFSTEQHHKHEKDGTLRGHDCESLETFDTQSVQYHISEKNVVTEGPRESCPERSNSLALFDGNDHLDGESTNTVADAAAAVEVRDGDTHSESRSRDEDSGRVGDASVEDSALSDAQMFASICSDADEPVAGVASSRSESCVSRPSPSPQDNAACGLVDPSDICLQPQTIPANDSDVLSSYRASSHNTAHLERFDDEVRSVSSSLAGMGHFHHDAGVELSEATDNSADVVHDDTCLYPAVVSTGKKANDFDAGEERVANVKQLDGHCAGLSEVCLQLISPSENSAEPPSLTDVTTAVSDNSVSLDPYEQICDDLLESAEANISDTETSQPSSSTCQAASATCSTDVGQQLDDKSSERLKELTAAKATLTNRVVVSSGGVERQPTQGSTSTLNSNNRHPATTLRRARTNFSVVYRHTTSQPTTSRSQQSSARGERVNAKANAPQTLSCGYVNQESGPIGCRRALAMLASRLDDHDRRILADTNVDGRAMRKSSFQSAAADQQNPDVAAASATVSLSSKVRPVVSSSTVARRSDATVAWTDVGRQSDLQTSQSQLDGHNATSVSADSKLPIAAGSSVSKKPSTFRKLLSLKLTNAVRRTK